MEYIKKVDLLAAAVEVEYLGRPRMMVSVATIGKMPSIEAVPMEYHDKVCEEMARRHQAEILELTADRPQGWIPCSERLPKAEEKVWIQTKRGKVCFAMYEDGTISEVDSDWHWYDLDFENWDEENDCGIIPEGWWEWTEFHPDNEFDCPVDEVVVAWMPLPSAYQGE